MTDIPESLVELERAAEQERIRLAGLSGEDYSAQWRRWRGAAEALQNAITTHAGDAGTNRYELEQSVKKAVRHADPTA
ncbi:hypothetical protein ACIRU3_38995 [Streptomyces sp. NPDC101151]|uniref:hypothetical protein n=1 Tax=Streptomyces sp. NPDC101151 TaxID=3366115 RepID=UPI0037FDAB2A